MKPACAQILARLSDEDRESIDRKIEAYGTLVGGDLGIRAKSAQRAVRDYLAELTDKRRSFLEQVGNHKPIEGAKSEADNGAHEHVAEQPGGGLVEGAGREPGEGPVAGERAAGGNEPRGNLGGGQPGERGGAGQRESAYPAGHELSPGAGSSGEPDPGTPASRDLRDSRNGRPPAQTAENTATGNFRITGELDRASFAPKPLFRSNVEAIRLLKKLEEQRRQATPQEQAILAGYVGWGGLKQAFDPNNRDWAKEHAELKELLAPEEFQAANRSILDAHYTSRTVVDAVWSAMRRMGFDGGRTLEPSMGTGNFFGLMPPELHGKTKLHGVELDNVTGGIAKLLYPEATIHAPRGFNDLKLASESFDAAIGNPPFGDQSIFDANHKDISRFKIHAFFFAKSLDKVRPGGLLGMVVSKGLLDAGDPNAIAARAHLAKQAELVGAIRLPNTAFKSNANTEVTTDLVFLRKLAPGERGNPEAWTELATVKDPASGQDIRVNKYFADHPDMMLGDMTLTGTMYRADEPTLAPREGQNLGADLAEAVAKLPANVMREAPRTRMESEAGKEKTKPDAPADLRPYSHFVEGGKLYIKLPDHNGEPVVHELEAGDQTMKRMAGMIAVRDAARAIINGERNPATTDPELKMLRGRLNRVYDDFVKKFGYLGQDTNKRAFREDADAPLLLSLEKNFDKGVSAEVAKKTGQGARRPTAGKADIFSKRTIEPERVITEAASAKDAMFASLNERGRIDIDYMAGLYKKSPAEVIRELGELVFHDPDAGWQPRDGYLSGNVKTKLARAEAAANADPESYARNVEALRKVQPPDKKAADIFVQLGSTWVPMDAYRDFVREAIEGSVDGMFAAPLGKFVGLKIHSGNEALNNGKYGTKRMSAASILEHLIGNKPPAVYDIVGDRGNERRVLNEEETAAAQGKAEELQNAFQDWIWKDADRREALSRIYNDRFNTNVKRVYDGAHMTFPGMNRNISFRPHQSNMVYRALQDGNLLADHVVGAGKTFAFAATAMEMRRLGLAKKPMITVPNHLVLEWAKQFKLLYPGANILAATRKDFEKSNRRQLFAKIATGDWDAVVVAHSSFGFIPVPPEMERALLEEQKADIVDAIEAAKKEQGKRFNTRDLEKAKERVEAKMERLAERRQDMGLHFGELGVDALMVDEAHEFKNLFYTTTMNGVSGLGDPAGSTKAFDMYVKTQYVQSQNAGKNVFFATGTPVANTIAEIFHMQRFLQMTELKARAIHQFDAWANTFGRAVTDWVMDAAGRFQQKTRFSDFQNLKELKQLWNAVTDTVTKKDLIEDAQKQGKRFPLPNIAGGKPRNVLAERSPQQVEFIGIPRPELDEHGQQVLDKETGVPVMNYDRGTIIERLDNWRSRVKENPREMPLVITGDARKAGLDYRLIDRNAPDFPGSKVNLAVDEIHRIWKENQARRGTQLVFIDLSTPKSAKGKATADAAAKVPTFFVRNGDAIAHVPGVKTELAAAPDDAFFSYKDGNQHRIVDAVSGLRLGSGRTKQEAIDEANSAIGRAGLERFRARSQESAIDPADIRDYIARWEDQRAAKSEPAEGDGEAEQEVSIDELLADQGKSDFSVYDDIREKLIARGIPREEVAFIHDFDTDLQKEALFERVNNGAVRVLLGSTKKMGAGTNVQRKLVAKHDLDSPWRPADLEQRDGRIVRQGNEFYEAAAAAGDPDAFEVQLLRYATKQTYDARMWEIIEQKARSIETFKTRDDLDSLEDISSESANAADMKAGASGDPRILESIQLNAEIKKLQAQERSWKRSRFDLEESATRTLKKQGFPWSVIDHFNGVKDIAPEKTEETKIDFDGKRYDAAKPASDFTDRWVNLVKAMVESNARPHVVGKYRGFDIIAEGDHGSPRFALAAKGFEIGSTSYGKEDKFSASGFVSRLDDQIRKIPMRITDLERVAAQREHEAEQAKAELQRDFPKAEELAKARERQRNLLQELRAPRKKPAAGATPEGEDEAKLSREERPLFYSELERRLTALPQRAGDASQWKGIIDNLSTKGVKRDEIEWSGVKDWLALQRGTVTKDQVLSFLHDNGVRVEETMLGGDAEAISRRDRAVVDLDARGYDVITQPDGTGQQDEPIGVRRRSDGQEFYRGDQSWDQQPPAEVAHLYDLALSEDQRAGGADDVPKFSEYKLPGGEDYRELLLTLPGRGGDIDEGGLTASQRAEYNDLIRRRDEEAQADDYDGMSAEIRSGLARLRETAQRSRGDSFRSSHFDQPNILAHVRFDTRTDAEGKRVLFIEEIQSDWAQKGKREGFRQGAQQVVERDGLFHIVGDDGKTADDHEFTAAYNTRADAQAAIDRGVSRGVPAAPFVGKTEAWVALAVKRMIRYAAEKGYDRVAWTTGDQQAERYDLSKHIDRIEWTDYDDAPGRAVTLMPKRGSPNIFIDTDERGMATGPAGGDFIGKHLSDIVGKDMAEKIMAKPRGILRGLELKVGGEGMKGFYDRIVPNVVNDVLKKLGGGRVDTVDFRKVGRKPTLVETFNTIEEAQDFIDSKAAADIEKPTVRDNLDGVEVWGIDRRGKNNLDGNDAQAIDHVRQQPGFNITAEMRAEAMKGLPLFSRGNERGTGGAVDIEGVVKRLGLDARVVATVDDLPEHLRASIERQEAQGDTRGIFDPRTGDVWLVGSGIHSEGEAVFVALHESAHRGLMKLFGDDLRPVLEHIFLTNDNVQQRARSLMLRYGYDRPRATEEVIADLALRGQARNLKGWERFVDFVRKWLVKQGFPLKVSDEMVEHIAGAAVQAGKAVPEAGEAEARLSRAAATTAPGTPVHLMAIASKLRDGLSDEVKQRDLARGAFREALASLDRQIGTTDAALEQGRQTVDKVPVADRWAAMHQFQTDGAAGVTDARLKPLFVTWKALVDQRTDKIQGWDEGFLKEALPNYFSQMWKNPKGALEWYQRMMGKGPLEGGRSFLKRRSYASYKEGMSWKVFDEHGGVEYFDSQHEANAHAGPNDVVRPPLEPVSQNFVDVAQLSLQQMDKFIAMHEFRQYLKEERGWVKRVKRGDTPPPGYAKVDDPAFRSRAVFTVNDPMTGRPEAAVTDYDYMVPALVAKDLNNYLSKGLYEFGFWRSFRYAQNLLLSARLGFSAFHAGFTTMDTLVSHADVGARYLLQGDVGRAVKTWAKMIVSPLGAPIEGRRLLDQFYGKAGSDVNTRAVLDFLTQGGARGRMNPTDFNNSWTALKRAWEVRDFKGTALQALPAVMEGVMRPIMHYLVPWQKMTARVLLAKFELDRVAESLGKESGDYAHIVNAMSDDAKRQIAYKVVQQVDDRLGQVAYDNLFWNKFAKDVAQASIQSVGWNVGTANVILGGLKDVGRLFKPEALLAPLDNAGKVQGDLGRVTGRLSYLVSLNLTVGMMGAVMNYLLTGEDPKDLRDYFFPRTGRKNPDGSAERISMPSYIKDEYALATHPVTTVEHKLHPMFSMVAELIKNQDFYGNQIVNPDDPWTKMATQVATYLGKGVEPYAVSNLQQNRARGSGAAMQAAPFIGITPAPASVSRSAFEAYVAERYQDAYHETLTPEGAEKAQARRDAIAAVKGGQQPNLEMFTGRERMAIFTASRTPIQEARFKRLSLAAKLTAWDKATPEERAQFKLKPLIVRDFMLHQTGLDPELRTKALEIIRAG